jgi:hypothetical protein
MLIKNIKNIALGIGIMILLPIITNVGTRLIVKYPNYSKIDKSYTRESYRSDMQKFNKYHFYTHATTGIVAIFIGVVAPIPFLSMGLVLGGVFCLVGGYFSYWNEIGDLIKFISLLIALLLLVFSSFKLAKIKKK